MLYNFFVYLFVAVTSVPWESFLNNNNVASNIIPEKNLGPPARVYGVVDDGISVDFKNGQGPWKFMKGINGQAR